MIRLRFAVVAGSALALATTAASGQSRVSAVPASMLPPAGMCRVWIEGVPASRQPAVTDCPTARASLRTNSRVIYGGSSNGRLAIDPRDPRYDERLNPNSPRYDRVYAERVRGEYDRSRDRMSAEERMRYEARLREATRVRNEARVREEMRLREEARLRNDSRYSNEREKRNRELQKDERKREKEIEKSERKRDKEWKKDKKHDGDRHDRDDH